jgi:hypothetical protein
VSYSQEGIVPWVVFLYYFFLECFPIALMLFLLWRLPSRRPAYLPAPESAHDNMALLRGRTSVDSQSFGDGQSFEHFGAHPELDGPHDDLSSWESQHNSDPLLPNASTVFYGA